MSTAPPDTESASVNIAVQLAKLTGKVEQVIGDHERRITNLETRRDGGSTRVAALFSPFIAGAAVVLIVVDKIPFK